MCKEDKIIINHVDNIKEKVNMLTGGYSDEETLDDIITLCRYAKTNIERDKTKGFYICRCTFNLGEKIVYYMLGDTNKVDAVLRSDGIIGYDEKRLVKVSDELYQEYFILYKLNNIYKNMKEIDYSDSYFSTDELSMVFTKISNQCDKLDIDYSPYNVTVIPYSNLASVSLLNR